MMVDGLGVEATLSLDVALLWQGDDGAMILKGQLRDLQEVGNQSF